MKRLIQIACGLVAIVLACLSAPGDPLAELRAAVADLDAKRYTAAIAKLKPLGARLPKLNDYVAWFRATAELEAKDYGSASKSAEAVWASTPVSPLAARAVLLAAQALGENEKAKEAVDLLRARSSTLPQPAGDLALAQAFAAAGDNVSAAVYYQRVYYGYPLSKEAAQAEADLPRLHTALGEKYPPAMPNALLGRALKLLDANHHADAKRELEALVPKLGGVERDLARVRIGVADYNARQNLVAHRYLAGLTVESPEADAERLHYLVLVSRRLKNQDDVNRALEKLARQYPNSKWRLEALIASGNHYLIENQIEAYEPLYRACYEAFPKDPKAAVCHWKVTWGHYLRRRADAPEFMRAHVRMFPFAESAPAALYFLGRSAEAANDPGAARVYYEEVVREYPNYYYTVESRARLAKVAGAAPNAGAQAFLKTVQFPERSRTRSFEANASSRLRMERAQLLESAGLSDWAEGELKFAAQTEDQPHLLAMELAALATKNEGTEQALRYIKRYASGYLFMPVESAPTRFWQYAFPLPYRPDLERFSKQHGVDPFLMAALIRQESEFNPKAVSRANARGLTQILPSTGKELSRRLKVHPYTTASLFQPVVNMQLGTFYLKSMVDHLNGHVEAALAAYNAGLSRAHAWLSWGEFREPAEFIETVPFTETHDYIQTVLRNADVYRRVYQLNQRASAQ